MTPGPGAPDLYGLPLEEFTAARNALAKELARQGERRRAEEVKRLPKPTRTAWALNQLARRAPEDVERLLAAGEGLRRAQQRALEGDATGLRDAARAEQEQVGRLLHAALAILGDEHPPDGTVADRLRNTLRAAANEPATGALLREGRVVRDLEPAGFGLDGLVDVADAPPPAPPARRPGQDRARRQAQRDAARQADRLAKEADAATSRARRLAEEAERAERRGREARAEADAASAEAARLRQEAGEAAARAAALESGDDPD